MAKELLDRCVDIAQKDPNYNACGDPNSLIHFHECAIRELCGKENEDYNVSLAKSDLVCSPEYTLSASR